MMTPLVFFKALADDTRLKCLLLIYAEKELCVCELMAALGESQPKISRHLAQLKLQGVLADRRQGQWVFYRLADTLPSWCHRVLSEVASSEPEVIQVNMSNLCAMGDRPARAKRCC